MSGFSGFPTISEEEELPKLGVPDDLIGAVRDVVYQEGRYVNQHGRVDEFLSVVPKGAIRRLGAALRAYEAPR